MTVANRSPAPTVQNLPDNRSSISLISRSATHTTPFGGFGISCERAAPKEWPLSIAETGKRLTCLRLSGPVARH